MKAQAALLAWMAGQAFVPGVETSAVPGPLPYGQAPPEASAGKPALALRGFISIWSQDGGLPAPIVKNDPVDLAIALPEKAGEFRVAKVTRQYEGLKVSAAFYALCPKDEARPGCPSRYYSVQVELSGAAAALCGATLDENDVAPFPVLVCGAPSGHKRLGATLHRTPRP